MPLAAWQSQLKASRAHGSCVGGETKPSITTDKTLLKKKKKESMNAQMEGTTSGNSFPPGQAMHTQI